MAYQSKKHRKFLATSMTAALVATAVAPAAGSAASNFTDVPADNFYYEYVKALADANIIDGRPDGSFDLGGKVTRAEASKMLANILQLDTKTAPAANFSDVKQDVWYAGYVNALSAKGLINGKGDGKFDPNGTLTRAEFAKMVVEAYDLELKADGPVASFTDINGKWYTDYVKILFSHGLITGTTSTTFSPEAQIKRGDFAKLLVVSDREYGITLGAAKVTGVSATNATTLTLTGNSLGKLTAADVTVENNTVKSFTASADGKSATVVLNDQLVPDVATKVTVKGTSFDVTYKIEATKISVVEATYDDDIANQFVEIQVDGKKVTAQELINAGYSLNFEAFTTKAALAGNNVTTDLFKSTSTGELNTDLATSFTIPTAGLPLYVKVTLTKGSEVITSDVTQITIKNLDLAAESITGATLENYGADGNDSPWANDFYQNSSTLVTGETAEFVNIKVKAGTEEEKVTSGYSVTSSDVSVISVTNGVLKAEGPGTATVTVKYGNATYTKTFTVTNVQRKATKIEAAKTSLTLTEASSASTDVTLLDQYGDPMAITGTNVVLVESNSAVASASLGTTADEYGTVSLTFTGNTAGQGTNTVTFRDAAGAKIGTTVVKATVTDNDTLAKYGLAVDSSISSTDVSDINTALSLSLTSADISTDDKLDIQSDKYVKINLSGLNAAGVKVSNEEIDGTSGDYTVTVQQSSAGVLADIEGDGVFASLQNGYLVLEAGTTPGTATITVKNATNNNIAATIKVTVESVGYNVTNATLKNVAAPTYATTLDYTDFLSYTAADASVDPVVSGLTLSKASAQPVRIELNQETSNTEGTLYIDKDADGIFNNNDVIVGSVAMSTVGTFANSVTDAVSGLAVVSGDNGTVLFKVLDSNGAVVATKSVKVDF